MTRWTPAEDARLAALRVEGMSDADIGAALGRTMHSVSNRVCLLKARGRGADIPTRKRPSQWTPQRVAEARAMSRQGLTVNQVARRLGTSSATVGRALRSPETKEDSPGEGVRVARTVPDLDRTMREVEQARAALARAEARHREAVGAILEPLWEAIGAAGIDVGPEVDDGDGIEDSTAWKIVGELRRRGLELRRVA